MKKIFTLMLFLFFAGELFLSCKKEGDKIPPVISISFPTQNSSFSVFDTISLNAQINDETQLKMVSAQILKEDLTPALQLYSRTPSEKNYWMNWNYMIDDAQLVSGNYYMCISGSDGVNETKEYVKIYISEAEPDLQGIIIVSKKNFNTADISLLDNNNTIQPIISLTSDSMFSSVSSKYQLINIDGNGFDSYGVQSKTLNCNVPSPGSGAYFYHLDFYNEINYLCYDNGYIKGFDKNCAAQFTAKSSGAYKPQKSFLFNTQLIVEELEVPGGQRRISVYYSNGSYMKSIQIDFEIVSFAKKDENNVFLFGNKNGSGKFFVYNISNDDLFEPYTISSGKISDVVQINSNTYLIALPDGAYKYDYNPANFIKHINMTNIEKLKYDALTNRVISSIGGTLKIYDYGSGQLLNTYYHSYHIKDIHFLFNK